MRPNQESQSNPEGRRILLGVGLDGEDGHTRITRGESTMLVGGSQDTHEQMQEKTIKLGEVLDRRGKTLQSASPNELRDILHDIDP